MKKQRFFRFGFNRN